MWRLLRVFHLRVQHSGKESSFLIQGVFSVIVLLKLIYVHVFKHCSAMEIFWRSTPLALHPAVHPAHLLFRLGA